jgi:hypothetical protein
MQTNFYEKVPAPSSVSLGMSISRTCIAQKVTSGMRPLTDDEAGTFFKKLAQL